MRTKVNYQLILNPFVDVQEPMIIGQGQYLLQSLANMIDNPIQIPLIGSNYQNHGNLHVNILPTDANGVFDEENEDLFIEEPEELLERGRLDFAVEIEKATDLPSNFCKDVYVEYEIFIDGPKYKTQVIEGKNRHPEFLYRMQHVRDPMTQEFLDYLMNRNVSFKVFGFPDVEKADDKKEETNDKKNDQNTL